MTYETIVTDLRDGVLVITMNRPERLNAWTYQMGAELRQAIVSGNEDEAVDAMILTGAGRGFCAGADIQDVFKAQADNSDKDVDGHESADTSHDSPRDWVQLIRSAKPMVAAINGPAIGVGLTQVLPMDYIVAAEGAKLSVRFIKMGLVPELASSHFLVARLGFGAASELMLTGGTVLAEEAGRIGLVDRVTAPGDLLKEAHSIARAMGDNPQTALRMVKALITANMAEGDLGKVQQREIEALQKCYASAEHHEAIAAFMEKRTPDFRSARSRIS